MHAAVRSQQSVTAHLLLRCFSSTQPADIQQAGPDTVLRSLKLTTAASVQSFETQDSSGSSVVSLYRM